MCCAARRRWARTGPSTCVSEDADSQDLAELPGVVAITPYTLPELRDERSSQIVAANLDGSGQPVLGTGYLAWLASKGFTPTVPLDFAIDVTDEGIDNGKIPSKHPDLFVAGSSSRPSRLAYHLNYTSDGGKRCQARLRRPRHHQRLDRRRLQLAHRRYLRGLGRLQLRPRGRTPGAAGGVEDLPLLDRRLQPRGSFTNLTSQAYARGARIASNSWGTAARGLRLRLQRVRRAGARRRAGRRPATSRSSRCSRPATPGSAETVASPATGKNVIAVGATEGVRASGIDGCDVGNGEADQARDVVGFSGRGSDRRRPPQARPRGAWDAHHRRRLPRRLQRRRRLQQALPRREQAVLAVVGDVALHAGGGGRGGAAARRTTGARRARCPRRR